LLQKGRLSYKASGVDIIAGDDLISRIKPVVAQTNRNGVLGSVGGFGGLFDTKAAGYEDPILVSGTDGVGTKLKVEYVECRIEWAFSVLVFLKYCDVRLS
jgi:phosphoribosylaminoimidazole (AIR) synthetase